MSMQTAEFLAPKQKLSRVHKQITTPFAKITFPEFKYEEKKNVFITKAEKDKKLEEAAFKRFYGVVIPKMEPSC